MSSGAALFPSRRCFPRPPARPSLLALSAQNAKATLREEQRALELRGELRRAVREDKALELLRST